MRPRGVQSPEYRERKARAVEAILAKAKSGSEVAREFGVSRQAVSLWVKQYTENGGSFPEYKRRGRPKLEMLPASKLEPIRKLVLANTPGDLGIDSINSEWDSESLRALFHREYNLRYDSRFAKRHLLEWGLRSAEEESYSLSSDDSEPISIKESPRQYDPITRRKPGRPRKDQHSGKEDPDLLMIDYEAGIQEAQSKMDRPYIPLPLETGVRTGKHARQRIAPGKKKRKKRKQRN